MQDVHALYLHLIFQVLATVVETFESEMKHLLNLPS